MAVATGLAGGAGGCYVGGWLAIAANGGLLFAIAASTTAAVALRTILRRNTLRPTELGRNRSANTFDARPE